MSGRNDRLDLTPQQVAEQVAADVLTRYPEVKPRDFFELALLTAALDTATELCRPDRDRSRW